MFNLREQLVSAGVVSPEEAKKAEQRPKKVKPKNRGLGESDYVKKLRSCGKGEQYQKIAKWVKLNRLDRGGKTDKAEKFYFTSHDKRATWLLIENETAEAVKSGNAVVMAYMSHQGMAHAIMPKEIAQDVGTLFPDWICR